MKVTSYKKFQEKVLQRTKQRLLYRQEKESLLQLLTFIDKFIDFDKAWRLITLDLLRSLFPLN